MSRCRTSLGGEGACGTGAACAGDGTGTASTGTAGTGAAGTGASDVIKGWQGLTWKTVRGHLDDSRRASTEYQVNPRARRFQALRLSMTGRLLTESGKKGWWPNDFLCDEHELRTHGVRNTARGVFAKYASRDTNSESARNLIAAVARIVTRFLRPDKLPNVIPDADVNEMDDIIEDRMSAILEWWNDQRGGSSVATAMPPPPPV